MPRRQQLVTGNCYHLYNRGTNRGPIFFEQENYRYFVQQFREYVASDHAVVLSYVLMPNHYHFLIQAVSNELSKAMQKFSISYTKSINKRHDRVGSLFQGAFRAKWVDEEGYSLHLSRYIHLNPVRAKLCHCPEDWTFSSYPEFVGLRNGSLPNTELVLSEFGNTSKLGETQKLYKRFVESYSSDDREKIEHLLF